MSKESIVVIRGGMPLRENENDVMEDLNARLAAVRGQQQQLFDDAAIKGQRTRLENQIATHRRRMNERRNEIEEMRLGAFPAPQLFNMVIVTPA